MITKETNHTSTADVIPEMTNLLGKYWSQPSRFKIGIDDVHAIMSETSLDLLKDYSCSQPSGVYEGKMWKTKVYGGLQWRLHWFGIGKEEGCCSNNSRLILIV